MPLPLHLTQLGLRISFELLVDAESIRAMSIDALCDSPGMMKATLSNLKYDGYKHRVESLSKCHYFLSSLEGHKHRIICLYTLCYAQGLLRTGLSLMLFRRCLNKCYLQLELFRVFTQTKEQSILRAHTRRSLNENPCCD